MQIGRNFLNTEDMRVARKGKRVFVNVLERHEDVGQLVRYVSFILNNPETRNVVLYFPKRFRLFPNIVVPLACLLDFLKDVGVKVTLHTEYSELVDTACFSPIPIGNASLEASTSAPAGIVWKYSTVSEMTQLLDIVIEYLTRTLLCESGVLHALEWCLCEVMDNVFQHSGLHAGYFMFQLQKGNRRLSFAVADQGTGIYRSFAKSRYRPTSAADAITFALRRGVSSSAEGGGNGLWGASEIITQNRGQMTVTSGGGAIFYNRNTGQVSNIENVFTLSEQNPGTHIDFQLDASVEIDLKKAFAGDYEPVDIRTESMANRDGFVVVPVKQMSIGTGTREAGLEMRVYVQNLMNKASEPVLVDFSEIGMVSTSYADEFLGKLYRDTPSEILGAKLRIAGLNDTAMMIVRNAVAHRIKH